MPSNSQRKTVVILGAGAVRGCAGGNSTTSNSPPLDSDFFAIARKNRATRTTADSVRQNLGRVVGDSYADELMLSLEATTSLLHIKAMSSKDGDPAHSAYLQQLSLIASVLARTTNNIRVGPRSSMYRLLLKELSLVDRPANLTIITFNYDLLIERTLHAMQQQQSHGHEIIYRFPQCYGFTGPITRVTGKGPKISHRPDLRSGIQILKLHGSLNWHSRHLSSSPSPKALFKVDRSLAVDELSEISTNPTTLAGSTNTSGKKGRPWYLKPIIVPPVSGKQALLHKKMVPIWSQARSRLQSATRLVVCGYSCPLLDFEARILLGENVRPTTLEELVMIDPDPGIGRRVFPLCGIDRAECFLGVDAYLKH